MALPFYARDDSGIEQEAAMLNGDTIMAKLLLIEDDRETADEIIAELVDRGFEVDWAATGIQGLDKARSSQSGCDDRRSTAAWNGWSYHHRGAASGRGAHAGHGLERAWALSTTACAGCARGATII